jgi:hypothetical protein
MLEVKTVSKQPAITDETLKQIIFKKNRNVEFKIQKGIVTIVHAQNHPIQRFFRKLHVKIPEHTYLDLDEYGSFVFRRINGKRSVYEIGKELSKKYPEAEDFLYRRLLMYLEHIETNEHLIQRVPDNKEDLR